MLQGRKLEHLEGVRFDGMNYSQWWTYLTTSSDYLHIPPRRQRWKDAWSWWLGDRTHTWGKPFN